jgi:hypothetical protein
MPLLTRLTAPLRRTCSVSLRNFSSSIPNIEDHAVGRQRLELNNEKEGMVTFNRDPIDSDETQGNSKDDPILVPSFSDSRAVGVSHNDSSYVFWFNMTKGKVHYLPQIEKYFLLYNPAELAELVKEVEAKQQ